MDKSNKQEFKPEHYKEMNKEFRSDFNWYVMLLNHFGSQVKIEMGLRVKPRADTCG